MLSSGTRLGTYEVTSHIGSGGMGDVYQAHDSKLGRDVAIKVLPEQFARDPERLARFQREAKMLAALNHPNIAAIYGLEQSDSTHYLVMELVPGQTLRERVAGERAVPVEEALVIAKQIAEALEAAHGSEKGIIHRDLKPANVKVTPEGRVKVLDFGLAKAFAAEPSTEDIGNSPTLSAAPTMQGVIMGTAAYMSPEQARGKAVTKATDIFAFGAVLYELLTGKQAFQGEDVGDILATVVKTEPDWSRLPEGTPPAIRTLLRRCLRKDRRQRLQDAASLRIEIEDVLSGAAPAEATGALALGRPALIPSLAVLLLVAAIAGLAAWMLKPAPPPDSRPISRFDYHFPEGHQFRNAGRTVMALSPDGSRFVYNTTQGLYLRSLDQLEARLIPGTEGTLTNPFFSPDGQWVGYSQTGQLKKIAVSGGAPVTIGPATNPFGVSWAPDNTILFAQPEGIRRVSANGGTPEVVIEAEPGEQFDGPQMLPGGEWVLFTAGAGQGAWDDAQIVVQSLETKEQREVWRGGSDARYVPTGHIVYALDDDLFAIPFDLDTLTVTGGPVPLVEGVFRAGVTASANYGISDGGSLVYVSGSAAAVQRTLVWLDRRGNELPLPAPARGYDDLSLSPDGRQVAVQTIESQTQSIWIYDIPRGTMARLTFEGNANLPVWTPDGKRVVYRLTKPAADGLFWKPADGSGPEESLFTTAEFGPQTSSVSPDGQTVAFYANSPATGTDLWVFPMQGQSERKPRPFLQTPFTEAAPRFSPDGRWLVYSSNESGRSEIYVQPYPGPGGKWLISTEGGNQAVWARNGRALFFRSGDKMMAVDIQTQPAFQAGTPRMLFERAGYLGGQAAPDYDVSPDGQRFLMMKEGQQPEAAQRFSTGAGTLATTVQVHVVLNWFEELKQRAPAGKQ